MRVTADARLCVAYKSHISSLSKYRANRICTLFYILPRSEWYSIRHANFYISGYKEPLIYNFSVAREFLKQVYVAERLQPPTSLSTLTNAYNTLLARARNPAYWRELGQTGEWAKVGVYAVEAYGIFKVSYTLMRHRQLPAIFILLTPH